MTNIDVYLCAFRKTKTPRIIFGVAHAKIMSEYTKKIHTPPSSPVCSCRPMTGMISIVTRAQKSTHRIGGNSSFFAQHLI